MCDVTADDPASETDTQLTSKGARTRRSILDAAIARFGRDGYRATSVADVARDAGVGGTVAYAYFPNKEALFLAAADEDAAELVAKGLSIVFDDPQRVDWFARVMATLVGSLDEHPMARRLLAGLEPEVTQRVLEIPALAELRKACTERLRAEQIDGTVRQDIDPAQISNGMVMVILSLLRSTVQLGLDATAPYAADITAVFAAAIDVPRPPAPA